jgi:hypothetical protein
MSRFKDLSSDVYYELIRRYPEFKEEVRLIFYPSMTLILPLPSPQQPPPDAAMISPGSAYDDSPTRFRFTTDKRLRDSMAEAGVIDMRIEARQAAARLGPGSMDELERAVTSIVSVVQGVVFLMLSY